jgi:O-acetyl-ADP-ribose deacetylase (regulator of RNase III)
MPLEIVCSDITKMKVDAIVNAANSSLRQGGGVCGAIFAAAGAGELQAECDGIGYCPVGGAVITKGYALPARYIIHTVGPVWQGGTHNEEELLSSCYLNSLKLALEHGLASVAFPLISSGIFGYPVDKAMKVAVSAIGRFLLEHEMSVYLVVFGKTGDDLLNSSVLSP